MDKADFVIKEDCREIILESYGGKDPHVVIPDGVTKLSSGCFSIPIASITVPETLTSVSADAFCDGGAALADGDGFCKVGCYLVNYIGNAEVLQIPEGIKAITWRAFSRNETLKKVIIPDSVEVIGKQAFWACDALEEVLFTGNAQSLRRIEDSSFYYCNKLRSIHVPDGVRHIGDHAFAWSETLESISIPDSVETIGDWAFGGCKNLRSINLTGVKKIGCGAFESTSLTSIELPESLEILGDHSFRDCYKLKTVVIRGKVQTVGSCAFRNCRALESVSIDEGVEIIGKEAFSDCYALVSFSVGKGVGIIGKEAFGCCYALVSFSVGKGVGIIEKKAFRECRSLKSVSIGEGGEIIGMEAFRECKKLESVSIGEGVKIIGRKAFSGCRSLKSVSIGKGVGIIEKEAFSDCYALRNLVIPNGVREIHPNAFLSCPQFRSSRFLQNVVVGGGSDFLANIGIGDENGCVIKDGTLIYYVGEPGDIRVTEGVERIDAGAFDCVFGMQDATKIKKIILPDSLVYFGENDLQPRVHINIPRGFLQRREKQPANFLYDMLSSHWKGQATILDFVCVLLFQDGKNINSLCREHLEKTPQTAAEAFLQATDLGLKGSEYVKGAEFIFEMKDKIKQETIEAFFAAAQKAKAKKAVDLLQSIVSDADKREEKVLRPIEVFCRAQFVEHFLDKIIRKADISAKSFEGVLYADTKEPAPAFVVKCAIVPYIGLMEERPKHISGYKTDYYPFSLIENADKVAAELDPETFMQVLEKMARVDRGYEKPQSLIPLCRYGNGNHVQQIVSEMGKWADWYRIGASGRRAIIVARGAILLNESREAMLYAEKCKLLHVYAGMRGVDADVLRDTKLSEFGLDESGKKLFDLGNTVIEASVGQDLSISLYDTVAEKAVKSLPKRGADPDKHAAATTELSDLKKNLKKVVKSRNDILFERFLDGESRKASAWIASYTKNPILHRIAELIVWSQKGKTFILTATGAVDHNGDVYQINDTDDISVAHPMDMKAKEIAAWQTYFTSHGLKQPFEQIWEPVVDAETVTADRYKDCMIPFYRFKGREKHGIHIQDWDFHNEIDISFEGCNAAVIRIDWTRHDINMSDRFEVQAISFRTLTRKVNHILAYLDRVTVYDRIIKDDVTVTQFLPSFTLAQITEFIKLAGENNSTNVTAILLDFQQKNFPDLDPMAEFTLD